MPNPNMTTISFKAEHHLKNKLILLAKGKGINVSACIKLLLTEAIKKELNKVTENGLTLREELEILHSDLYDKTSGPFKSVDELMKALKK